VKYCWDPEDYQKGSGEQQKWARELIAKLSLRGDERVLDIGCGDGKVTAEIARFLPNGTVLGIDSSEEMVCFAREHLGPGMYPNLSFEVEDARRLTFREEFDIVFSNATLHWVIDHRPVLRGIRRSLKPGGRLLAQMGGRGNAAGVVAILAKMAKDKRWTPNFTGFRFPYGFHGPEKYERWLKAAGLRPIRVELIRKDMVHGGRAQLAGWLRTTWLPYTQRIPEAERARFVDELVVRYEEVYPPDADGSIHVGMVRLEVEARRPENGEEQEPLHGSEIQCYNVNEALPRHGVPDPVA
jgi:trans-aconitate 2-methyltransferase